MNISVFGLGYVGAVITGCFAKHGHRVIGVDLDPAKVAMINEGRSPIIEPELEALIATGVAAGAIRATIDVEDAVLNSEISMICVGTPSKTTGDLDLAYIERVSIQIGTVLRNKAQRHIVVARSTMLPGSVERCIIPALERASGKQSGDGFGIAINPEFLRESTAVHDFHHPPKTVIGALLAEDADVVASLYADLDAPLITTSLRTAEMVKYTDNVFHALKVTFGNEIGAICKTLGVDGREVMEIFCQDRKLNLSPIYFRPGFAYGGSCLPKDLRAISRLAQIEDIDVPMLSAISVSNEGQIRRAARRVVELGKRKVAVLGFAFKGGTDDLRESPLVTLIEILLGKGFDLRLYDGCVSLARLVGANRRYIEDRIPHLARIMENTPEAATSGAELILIGNQSEEHAHVLAGLNAEQIILDLTPAGPRPVTAAIYEHIAS